MLFDPLFQEELLALMAMDTVTPMETGAGSGLLGANRAYAALAQRVGLQVVFEGPGSLDTAQPGHVPLSVASRVAAQPGFLAAQPHLVLAMGQGPRERTVMFNFHMDTVSPHLPVRREGGVIFGRGAVDNKGPGVAVLAALHALREQHPAVLANLRVLVQCVAGEEGGAMGVYGTRCLVEAGHVGRLNVFVEPTRGRLYFDSSTCSMTFEVDFDGKGSTDDFPEQGDNASVALGFVAQHMAQRLSEVATRTGLKLTVAGLHTGEQHNRVFGQGRLLLNLAYRTAAIAETGMREVEAAFDAARHDFVAAFAGREPFAKTAARFGATCRGRWLKAGLPVLNNRDPAMERLLAGIGLARQEDPRESFTCDAIWGAVPGGYAVVLGPGSLADNDAHTAEEHVHLRELEDFTDTVLRLLVAFAGAPGLAAETAPAGPPVTTP